MRRPRAGAVSDTPAVRTCGAACAGRSSASAISRWAAAARRRGRRGSRGCCVDAGERPAILSRGYAPHAARRTASSSSATAARHSRRSRSRRRRAADARAPAARRRRSSSASERYLAGRARRASLRRHGAPARRRVSAPATATRRRPRDRRAARIWTGAARRCRSAGCASRPTRCVARGRRARRLDATALPSCPLALRRAACSRCGARIGEPVGGRSTRGAPGAAVHRVVAVAGIAGSASASWRRSRAAGWQSPARSLFRDHHRYTRARTSQRSGRRGRACRRRRRVDDREGRVRLLPFRPFRAAGRRRAARHGASSRLTEFRRVARRRRCRTARDMHALTDHPPTLPSSPRVRWPCWRCVAVVRVLPMRAVLGAGTAARARVLRPRSARTAGSRCGTSRRRFRCAASAERRAIARQHVRALRPAAHGAAQVQHA